MPVALDFRIQYRIPQLYQLGENDTQASSPSLELSTAINRSVGIEGRWLLEAALMTVLLRCRLEANHSNYFRGNDLIYSNTNLHSFH